MHDDKKRMVYKQCKNASFVQVFLRCSTWSLKFEARSASIIRLKCSSMMNTVVHTNIYKCLRRYYGIDGSEIWGTSHSNGNEHSYRHPLAHLCGIFFVHYNTSSIQTYYLSLLTWFKPSLISQNSMRGTYLYRQEIHTEFLCNPFCMAECHEMYLRDSKSVVWERLAT